MPIDARTATAEDFEAAAQKSANATWGWLIVAGIVYYFWGWAAAALPGFLALLAVVQSVASTKQADNLRKGTYRIPNPNNGKP